MSRIQQRGRCAPVALRALAPRSVCLRVGRWLAVLALSPLASPGGADVPDRWRPYQDIGLLDRVTLRIHWFDNRKGLLEAAAESGQRIKESDLNGFSILKRNTQTGEYSCDLYVMKMSGALVDKDRTTTFGHEVLHCFGLKHD
jgi:hypothetical protein